MKPVFLPYQMFALVMVLAFSGVAVAQTSSNINDAASQTDAADVLPAPFRIDESDFSCFRDLNCLKSNRALRDKGLNVTFNDHLGSDRFILEGESRNERIYAEYNDRGGLVKGVLMRTNAILPKPLMDNLASGDYAGWQMIGNEMSVQHFDARTTEYKVILQKEGEAKILYFDRFGNEKTTIPVLS
jgi:hypothetical protein